MKVSVVALVKDQDGKFLAIKRRDVRIWVLPGGGVDLNEIPEKAVIREVFEETGLHVSIKRKIAEYTPINKLTNITHFYECIKLNGEIKTGNETKDIGYFETQNPPKPFFYVHKDMLLDAMRKEPDIIQKPFHQVTYWAFLKYVIKHPLRVLRFVCSKLGFPINSK